MGVLSPDTPDLRRTALPDGRTPDQAENAVVEQDSAAAVTAAVASLDVLEKTNPSGEDCVESLHQDPAREGTTLGPEIEKITGEALDPPGPNHGAVTFPIPDRARRAAKTDEAARRAQKRQRDVELLATLPRHERDLIADLFEAFDGVFADEETK